MTNTLNSITFNNNCEPHVQSSWMYLGRIIKVEDSSLVSRMFINKKDKVNCSLVVELGGTSTYVYNNVPFSICTAFADASSKGSFFARVIKTFGPSTRATTPFENVVEDLLNN